MTDGARRLAVEPPASMTGAGTALLDRPEGRFEVEVRSVNHRFLKTSARVLGPLPTLEAVIEDRVRARSQRGHVTVFLRFTPARAAAAAALDEGAFAAAADRLKDLARAHALPGPTVGDVLSVPGVRAEPLTEPDPERATAGALAALDLALEQFAAARRREGTALVADVLACLGRCAGHLDALAARAGEVPVAVRKRLEARLAELLSGTGASVDPQQLAREAALLADRADVREELARLAAHFDHAREVLEGGGSVGRRLDFLVQEMHRETNTIGSKAAGIDLARHVLDLKTDVERIREQVQNLE